LGPGKFYVEDGTFHFNADGFAFERDAEFGWTATPTFNGDFELGGNMLLQGGAIFGDNVIIDGTDDFSMIIYGIVYWGQNDLLRINYYGYADMHFDIIDTNEYDKVEFEADFFTDTNTSVIAYDHRNNFTYERDTLTNERADYGRQFTIITLSFIWPIETNGSSPFESVSYTVNITRQGVPVPDVNHKDLPPPRISPRTLDRNNEDSSRFLFLYAAGSANQVSLALFIIFVMVASFF